MCSGFQTVCPALRKDAYMQGTHAELKKANAGKTACSYSPLRELKERPSSAKVERLPSSAGMGPACRRRDKQQVGEHKHANPAVSPTDHTSCLPTRWPVCSTSIVAHHTQLPRHFPDLLPYRSHPHEAAPNEMGRINTHTHAHRRTITAFGVGGKNTLDIMCDTSSSSR